MAEHDRHQPAGPQPPSGVGPPHRDHDPEDPCAEDDVAQGSDLSFPASDPPSTSAPGTGGGGKPEPS